jgi:hypothetical protein
MVSGVIEEVGEVPHPTALPRLTEAGVE